VLYTNIMSLFGFEPSLELRAVGVESDPNEKWAILARESNYRRHSLAALLQVSVKTK
jgi:hypothetical protein